MAAESKVIMENENIESKNNAEISFEDAISRLEKLVSELENGKAPLAQSLKLFEEGIALVSECKKQLDEAEQKVRMLTRSEK